MTLEDRLVRLEETLFFQERLLTELNAALAGQQKQMDSLERMAADLRDKMDDLRQSVEAGAGPVNVPPPHYRER